jgi:hypothetical protein
MIGHRQMEHSISVRRVSAILWAAPGREAKPQLRAIGTMDLSFDIPASPNTNGRIAKRDLTCAPSDQPLAAYMYSPVHGFETIDVQPDGESLVTIAVVQMSVKELSTRRMLALNRSKVVWDGVTHTLSSHSTP